MAVITVPTLSQRLSFFRKLIIANNKGVATTAGSLPADLFISTLASGDVQQQALTFYTSVSQALNELLALKQDTNMLSLLSRAMSLSISDILLNISATIDIFGDNFDLTRKQPTKANGTVQVGRVDPTTVDRTVAAAKTVRASNSFDFAVIADVTMFAANAQSYFDPDLLQYVIDAAVEAVTEGSGGNAPSGTITTIVTPIEGFSSVTNKTALSGGSDLETDEDYVIRILARWQAVGRVTPAGILDSATNGTGVSSVYVAKQGDPLAKRGFGRSDIYILEKIISQATETFSGYNSALYGGSILPSKLPMTRLVATDSGVAFLQKDVTTGIAGSKESQDVVRFSTAPVFPVTVVYEYDAMVSLIQAIFDQDAFGPSTQQEVVDVQTAKDTALLVKESDVLVIDYTATIQAAPGFTKASVVADIKTNIASFNATQKLGGQAFVGDIDKIVEATTGVLRIQGEPTKFSPTNQVGVLNSVQAANNQVLSINPNIF